MTDGGEHPEGEGRCQGTGAAGGPTRKPGSQSPIGWGGLWSGSGRTLQALVRQEALGWFGAEKRFKLLPLLKDLCG